MAVGPGERAGCWKRSELLRPSWLSFLVSRELKGGRAEKNCNTLADIVGMFDKLTVGDSLRKIATEVMVHKYLTFNYLSLLFRAKRFFSVKPEGKFVVFTGFRKLMKDPEERKEKKKTVLMKNFIELSVQKQEEDMETLAKYSDGSLRILPPDSSFRAVLFNLEEPVCHPAQPNIEET